MVLTVPDHNGKVTKEELTSIIQRAGFRASGKEIDNMMKQADADGDGALSRDEIAAVVAQFSSQSEDAEED